MCSGSAGRAADPPMTAPAKTPPSQERGCPGGGKRTKKVNTFVLELVCLVTEQWQQQIFSIRAGQPPGGCSKKQNSLYQYVHPCTLPKEVCTGMYVFVLLCISMYRDIPLCTVMYHDIPRYTCTCTYQYVRVRILVKSMYLYVQVYEKMSWYIF